MLFFPIAGSVLGSQAVAAGVGHLLFGNAKLGVICFDGLFICSMLAGVIIGKAFYMMSDENPAEDTPNDCTEFNTAGGSYTCLARPFQ